MFASRLLSPSRLGGLFSALLLSVAVLHAQTPPPAYKGVVMIDAASGEVLHEDNADIVSPPASVTKLMTFLVVHDALAAGEVRLDTPITATAADQAMGGTQVHLAAGETYPVEELLYALMVQSANDAAHALTQIAGGREAFVARMNARAQGLGMTGTVYRSPHGLPPSSRKLEDSDVTSPRDQAILARELLTKTDVLRFSSLRTRPFGTGVRAEPMPMRNHNNLLGSVQGCDGLKTGYTRAAGFCLVATAQRGTKRVIVAILGSPDAKTRDRHVRGLIEQGFAKIPDSSVFTGAPTRIAPVAPEPAAVQSVTPVAPAGRNDELPSVQFRMPPRK